MTTFLSFVFLWVTFMKVFVIKIKKSRDQEFQFDVKVMIPVMATVPTFQGGGLGSGIQSVCKQS